MRPNSISHKEVEPAPNLTCPHCHGEGFFIYDGGPGRFDSRYGNWLPCEIKVPCDACGGTGELEEEEPERCPAPLNELCTDEELPF